MTKVPTPSEGHHEIGIISETLFLSAARADAIYAMLGTQNFPAVVQKIKGCVVRKRRF